MKLTVAQAAEKFKVSKEAVHNRIRRGSLDCVIEHGAKYVLIDEPSAAVEEDRYYSYIEEENGELKEKIAKLEKQNSVLRDQKEQMLIEEKNKIEQIYKDKDEQLKRVLHTITTNFLPHMDKKDIQDVSKEKEEEFLDVELLKSEPIRLKQFLKLKGYKPAKYMRIKNRFKRLVGVDNRVFREKGKVFIDPSKFNYSDLLD